MENELFIPKSSRTGTSFSPYVMVGIAEGFEPCNDPEVQIEAWASIGQTGMYRTLQGFFGRSLQSMIDQEFLFEDFTINWEMVDQAIAFN